MNLRTIRSLRHLSLLLASLACAPAAHAQPSAFETDRKAILALAGDYKVRFDFKETVSFVPDYKPYVQKATGGYETVRVVQDDGRSISLQHILVGGAASAPMVIKHWREDWAYEPASILTYTGPSHWETRGVPATSRKGAWAQVVWQTDDSPRYGAVGRWRHDGGVSRWTSEETVRPLARRDATRHPVYDRYLGTNRVALTPTGWVHEQDNAKLGPRGGREALIVREVGVNTYDRDSSFPVAAADIYWKKTAGYWADVRKAWDEQAKAPRGLTVREEPENGAMTGPPLMDLADKIADEGLAVPEAVRQARLVIAAETSRAAAAPPTH